jgi:hypothetical protein
MLLKRGETDWSCDIDSSAIDSEINEEMKEAGIIDPISTTPPTLQCEMITPSAPCSFDHSGRDTPTYGTHERSRLHILDLETSLRSRNICKMANCMRIAEDRAERLSELMDVCRNQEATIEKLKSLLSETANDSTTERKTKAAMAKTVCEFADLQIQAAREAAPGSPGKAAPSTAAPCSPGTAAPGSPSTAAPRSPGTTAPATPGTAAPATPSTAAPHSPGTPSKAATGTPGTAATGTPGTAAPSKAASTPRKAAGTPRKAPSKAAGTPSKAPGKAAGTPSKAPCKAAGTPGKAPGKAAGTPGKAPSKAAGTPSTAASTDIEEAEKEVKNLGEIVVKLGDAVSSAKRQHKLWSQKPEHPEYLTKMDHYTNVIASKTTELEQKKEAAEAARQRLKGMKQEPKTSSCNIAVDPLQP